MRQIIIEIDILNHTCLLSTIFWHQAHSAGMKNLFRCLKYSIFDENFCCGILIYLSMLLALQYFLEQYGLIFVRGSGNRLTHGCIYLGKRFG